MPCTIQSHTGMGTTDPGSVRRVDTSPTDTSQAARELLSTNSSGNSTVATYPAVRDTAGTAEEDFVPSAAWRSRQATNLIS